MGGAVAAILARLSPEERRTLTAAFGLDGRSDPPRTWAGKRKLRAALAVAAEPGRAAKRATTRAARAKAVWFNPISRSTLTRSPPRQGVPMRYSPMLAALLAAGCTPAAPTSPPPVQQATPATVPVAAAAPAVQPTPSPHNLPDPVDGVVFKVTKAAVVSAGGGEAVAVEFEQVAKKAGNYRVVISHGGKYTTVPAGQEWASVKGTPVRIIPAGSFAGGLSGPVRVWLEKETTPGGVEMGRPDLLASAKVEARRE